MHTRLLKREKDRFVTITFVSDGLVFILKVETKELIGFNRFAYLVEDHISLM